MTRNRRYDGEDTCTREITCGDVCRPELMEAASPLKGFQKEEGEMPHLLRNRIRLDSADGEKHEGNSFLSF